jgi:hypothetical protein
MKNQLHLSRVCVESGYNEVCGRLVFVTIYDPSDMFPYMREKLAEQDLKYTKIVCKWHRDHADLSISGKPFLAKIRPAAVGWMFDVAYDHFGSVVDSATVYQASVRLFDAIFIHTPIALSKVQLVAVTCIGIAFKLHRNERIGSKPHCEELRAMTDCAFLTSTISLCERELLGMLKWDFQFPAPIDALRSCDSIVADSTLFNEATKFMPALLLNPRVHQFSAIELAAAAVYATGGYANESECPYMSNEVREFAQTAVYEATSKYANVSEMWSITPKFRHMSIDCF